jgi:FkbM family methyltransferase
LHKFILTPEIIHAWGDSIIPPEQCLIEWARQFQSKDKVALDIGAHVGDWAVDMADYSKEVHAFEAQTSTYKLLLANAKGYSNIWCHSGALCEKRGDVDLAIRSPDGGGSSVVLYALSKFGNSQGIVDLAVQQGRVALETVRAYTLDSCEIRNISFIKLDVEGAERLVLQGGVETLEASGWPLLIYEAWSQDWYQEEHEKLKAYIKSLGYRIRPVTWPDTYVAEK